MKNRTNVATASLSLQALVMHMTEHQLPAPVSITMPVPGFPNLEVWLSTRDATVWVDSPGLVVVDEHAVPVRAGETPGSLETVHLRVTVPSAIGDVSMVLKYARTATRQLTVVGDAS